MGYYKIKIKEYRKKLLLCRDKEERKYLKRLIKEFKTIVSDKTRRD